MCDPVELERRAPRAQRDGTPPSRRTLLAGGAAGLALLPFASTPGSASEPERQGRSRQQGRMKIRITIEGGRLTATLADTATARDFTSLLPLTLTLNDYASTEKISDLPRRLSTEGAPAGVTPAAGDIAYYAPWGNLALFYKGFGYSSGLVRLGRLDGGQELLRGSGPLTVTIERHEAASPP